MFCDSHTHVQTYRDQAKDIVVTARSQGVTGILACGVTLLDSQLAISLAEQMPGIIAGVGLHPWQMSEPPPETLAEFHHLVKEHPSSVRAIGEVGLDFREPYLATANIQRQMLRHFVRLGLETGLPLSVHVRGDAHAEAAVIMIAAGRPGGAIHGFDGNAEDAERYLEIGMFVAAGPGLLTAPESTRDAFRVVPDERLLIETDSAITSGTTPVRVIDVATELARLRGTTLEEIASVTTRNFTFLFGD